MTMIAALSLYLITVVLPCLLLLLVHFSGWQRFEEVCPEKASCVYYEYVLASLQRPVNPI